MHVSLSRAETARAPMGHRSLYHGFVHTAPQRGRWCAVGFAGDPRQGIRGYASAHGVSGARASLRNAVRRGCSPGPQGRCLEQRALRRHRLMVHGFDRAGWGT
jgi:hypothetical protein